MWISDRMSHFKEICMILMVLTIKTSQGMTQPLDDGQISIRGLGKPSVPPGQNINLPGYKPGETVDLNCSEGEVIRVTSAEFRRQVDANCNSTQNVRDVCDGENVCQFTLDAKFFGGKCGLIRSRLIVQYECISDPCSQFCCANGGQCRLTDPKMDNFDPKCECSPGYGGQNCEDCVSEGFPCPWRNRTFLVYKLQYGGSVSFSFSADGMFMSNPDGRTSSVVKVLGNFFILKTNDRMICMHIDEKQSSVDSFVARWSTDYSVTDYLGLGVTADCQLCTSRSVLFSMFEYIAQDSNVAPRQSYDPFCEYPSGCTAPATAWVCSDNESLDFDEKCPE